MADIEHKALPDELLHEPKGASTAANGQVYVANGQGSGSFGLIPVGSLDFIKGSVAALPEVSFTNSLVLNSTDLSQGTDQTLNDIDTDILPVDVVNTMNKNTSELVTAYNNTVTILNQLKTEVTQISSKVNTLLTTLKNEGFIDE